MHRFKFSIIDRYVSRQVIFATVFGVAVLSIVLVLGSVFQRLIRELERHPDIGAGFVVDFMLNVLPYSLIFTVPWGFLTAILLSFGRLSADNELTSFRMAGLSMSRICSPVFVIAIFLTGFTLWMNIDVSPRSKARIARIFFELATENPGAMFVDDEVVATLPGYLAYSEAKFAENEEKGQYRMRNFQLVKLNDRKRPEIFMAAQWATIGLGGDDNEILILKMEGAHKELSAGDDADKFNDFQAIQSATADMELSLKELRDKHKKERPSFMTVPELRVEIVKAQESIVTTAAEAVRLGEQVKTLPPKVDKADRINLPETELEAARARDAVVELHKTAQREAEFNVKRLSSLRTEVQKRFSLSFACLTFTLIGIPLGVTAQRRETSVGFAMSLIIAIGYFLFLVVAEFFHEDPSAYPQLLIWLPNVVFLSLGLILFYRLSRK